MGTLGLYHVAAADLSCAHLSEASAQLAASLGSQGVAAGAVTVGLAAPGTDFGWDDLKGDGLVANRLPRPGVFCFILQLIQSWRVLSRRSQAGLLRRLPGRGITWYCGKSRAPPMQTRQGART